MFNYMTYLYNKIYINNFASYTKLPTIGTTPIFALRRDTKLFNEFPKKYNKLFEEHQSIVFLTSNETDKEICIYYKPNYFQKNDSIVTIIKKSYLCDCDIVGYNEKKLTELHIGAMYHLLGLCNINLEKFGLSSATDDYINFLRDVKRTNYKCNMLKMYRIYCYYLGSLCIFPKINSFEILFNKLIKTKNIHFFDESCLVVSKLITGYGGNQKTSIQLIEMLDKEYNVYVLSHMLTDTRKGRYNYETDRISPFIHNSQIIKLKQKDDIINYINESSFKFIINNKMNEFFSILPELVSRLDYYVITHNSMDPFNELIINNQNYITKCFTINKFHDNLIKKYFINKKIKTFLYRNYTKINNKVEHRTKFTNKLIFVGRLSKEKGIPLLLGAFQKIISNKSNLELSIVGDCDGNIESTQYYINHKQIKYLGKLNEEQVKEEMKKCDYLVLPSYTEGLPFVILEAMSLGIPCIYSDINGANEIINDEVSGFLFTLRGHEYVKENINSWEVIDVVNEFININVANLAECIADAYDITIEKWNEMSQNSYDYINNNFSKEKTIQLNMQAIKS